RLTHIQLHAICLRRPREECGDCWKRHQEVFELREVPGVRTFEDVIVPIVHETALLAAVGSG
ncbi:hypothetical protein V5O48_018683, partial [Marasmius crinis-equi]